MVSRKTEGKLDDLKVGLVGLTILGILIWGTITSMKPKIKEEQPSAPVIEETMPSITIEVLDK